MIKFTYLLVFMFFSLPSLGDEIPIPIFPGGEIESSKVTENKEHLFLLSTPKRISNTLNIENKKLINGNRTDTLIRINGSSSSDEAFRFYQNYLMAKGKVLYQCEQGACGSSNYWSNNIYNERKLYGRDSNQHYIVGNISIGEVSYWVSVYSVINGRKKHYVYLSYVPQKDSIGNENSSISWQSGRNFERAKLNEQEVVSLLDSLAVSAGSVVWVAAFSTDEGSVSSRSLIERSNSGAERFKDYLVSDLSINSKRIKTKAIGPLGKRPAGFTANNWFTLYVLKP